MLSVILLGAVAWSSSAGNELLRIAVVLGMAASILGMFLRWLSHHAADRRERA